MKCRKCKMNYINLKNDNCYNCRLGLVLVINENNVKRTSDIAIQMFNLKGGVLLETFTSMSQAGRALAKLYDYSATTIASYISTACSVNGNGVALGYYFTKEIR